MWPFFKPNFRLRVLAENIPRGHDIWTFHGPPAVYDSGYVLDLVRGKHVGNQFVTESIFDLEPQLVVCGHIHEGFGIEQIGSSPVANVAFVDEHYRPRFQHLEIEWDEDSRKIRELTIAKATPDPRLWSDCSHL